MPKRKRRFEALEDRRLLAAWVGSSTPTTATNTSSAETAPVNAASTTPSRSTSTSAADQSGSQSDGSTSDNYTEYGSAASNASSDAASYSSNYASSAYGNDPSNEYTATDSSKTPASSHTPAQPTVTSSLQPVVSDPTSTLVKASSVDAPTFSTSALIPAPSAAVSPPVARSSGDLVGMDEESAATPADALTANAAAEADVVAPIALASPAVEFNRISVAAATDGESPRADQVAPVIDFGAGEPITGWSPINFNAIEKGVDDVFDRLERLGNELEGVGATRFAEWLVIAGGACAAFEYARARYREGGPWQARIGWPIPCEPRLRRRWLGFRNVR